MATGNESFANGNVEMWTFDVGQADARFISTEQGENILVDADRNTVGEELEPVIARRTDERTDDDTVIIDYVVLTHIDEDHVSGLDSLVGRNCEIQEVIQPNDSRVEIRDPETRKPKNGIGNRILRNHKNNLEKHDIDTITQVSSGDSLPLESDTDIQILAPPNDDGVITFPHPETEEEVKYQPGGTNANGIVLKVDGPEQSTLFMGDVDDQHNAESWLVHQHHSPDSAINLDADTLCISHHGSKYGAKRPLLDAVEPTRANISSDLDQYGHPDYETFDRLHEYDATMPVDWTPSHGTIHDTLGAAHRTAHTKHGAPTTPAALAKWKHDELKPTVVAKAETNTRDELETEIQNLKTEIDDLEQQLDNSNSSGLLERLTDRVSSSNGRDNGKVTSAIASHSDDTEQATAETTTNNRDWVFGEGAGATDAETERAKRDRSASTGQNEDADTSNSERLGHNQV